MSKIFNKKKITAAVIIILSLIAIVVIINIVINSNKDVYESGHIFYEYDNDTDYINPSAPYINVGGRIYYKFKEQLKKSLITDYYNNVAYIEYDTGKAKIICNNKRCLHNELNYTEKCELTRFSSNMRIDYEGYIYGSYQDERLNDEGEYSVARYNLYNRSFDKLYTYKIDMNTDLYDTSYSNGYLFIYPYQKNVYFYEYIINDATEQSAGKVEIFLRRYNIDRNITETLAVIEKPPYIFDVFNDRIYTSDNNNVIFSYDLDYSEESKTEVLNLNIDLEKKYTYINKFQYDNDMKYLYFICYSDYDTNKGGDLYRIRPTDYTENEVVDRIPRKLNVDGKVIDYQLTYDCIYYTLYEKRFIGEIDVFDAENETNDMTMTIKKDYYDNTDGNIYLINYNELNNENITKKIKYNSNGILIRSWTIIGNYIYADLYELGNNEKIPEKEIEYTTAYLPSAQVRIDIKTLDMIRIKPDNFHVKT